MSAFALLIAWSLVGQVNSGNDRYSAPGGGPAQGAQAASPGLLPLDEADAQGSQAGDPYSRQGQGGNQRQFPTGTPAQRGVSAPPPFRGLQATGDALPGQSLAGQESRGPKPSAMMRDMLTPPPSSQLSGEPASLLEAVSSARTRLEQSQRVEAYWDLCSSVSDYYLGLREQDELRRLRSSATGAGAAWQQAEAELQIRMDTSLRAARAAQWRVAGWLGRAAERLPLPADLPHCGSYHTRYAEIFAGRPSAEAHALSELLPLRYAELKDAAAAVTRAEDFVGRVAREDPSGNGTLRALEFSALRRRAFVQIARDYNRRIARYTELASPGEIGAQRLIGMLIKVDNASTATRPGTPGRQSNNARDLPQRTFADGEGWEPAGSRDDTISRDEAVQPASGTSPQGPRRERSLLVSPR